MAWIESNQQLGAHPKTRKAARMLEVSRPAMVGHLHYLWWWALDYADDGDLTDYDVEDIADAALWDGDAQEFVDALIQCGRGNKPGFIECHSDGRIVLHDWLDYAGRLIEARTASSEAGAKGNHERWHVQRGISDPDCPLCKKAIGGRSGGDSQPDSGSDRVLSHRTVPNPTVPKQASNAHAREDTATLDDPTGRDGKEAGPLAEPCRVWHERIGMMPPAAYKGIEEWSELTDAGCVSQAIHEAADAKVDEGSGKRPTWPYVKSILVRWHNDGIRTAEAAKRERNKSSPDDDDGLAAVEAGLALGRSGDDARNAS